MPKANGLGPAHPLGGNYFVPNSMMDILMNGTASLSIIMMGKIGFTGTHRLMGCWKVGHPNAEIPHLQSSLSTASIYGI